jgi:sugar/nucleoside kinase (ribokinase family)
VNNTQFDVAVVGELNPDLILSGNVVPEFGQVEKVVDRASLQIGSSSAIFACGAARLGLRVAFIGKIGDDLFGKFMRDSLERYGIDTNGIIIDKDTPTGLSVILNRGLDRAILTFAGTIPSLRADEIDWEIIRHSRHLHIGSYYIQTALQSGLPRLADHAHELGLSISLDTNYDPSDKWDGILDDLLSKVDIFLPNEHECQRISKASNLESSVNILRKKVNTLAVKLGDRGALACVGDSTFRSLAIKVKVFDTVGAGDSFDAGYIYGYLAGWEPRKILKFASICGSLSTRKAGGTPAQPTIEEALKYL